MTTSADPNAAHDRTPGEIDDALASLPLVRRGQLRHGHDHERRRYRTAERVLLKLIEVGGQGLLTTQDGRRELAGRAVRLARDLAEVYDA